MHPFPRLVGASSIALAALASCPALAFAVPYTIHSDGTPTEAMAPSADALKLDAATLSTGLGPIVLQTATFVVGDSGSLMDRFPFTIDETVTINGQSLVIPLSGFLVVTNPTAANTDSWSFSNGNSIHFASAGVYLTPTFSASPAGGVGQSFTFNVLANLTTNGVVAEPDGLALFLLGLAAIGGLALATRRRDGVSFAAALPS